MNRPSNSNSLSNSQRAGSVVHPRLPIGYRYDEPVGELRSRSSGFHQTRSIMGGWESAARWDTHLHPSPVWIPSRTDRNRGHFFIVATMRIEFDNTAKSRWGDWVNSVSDLTNGLKYRSRAISKSTFHFGFDSLKCCRFKRGSVFVLFSILFCFCFCFLLFLFILFAVLLCYIHTSINGMERNSNAWRKITTNQITGGAVLNHELCDCRRRCIAISMIWIAWKRAPHNTLIWIVSRVIIKQTKK